MEICVTATAQIKYICDTRELQEINREKCVLVVKTYATVDSLAPRDKAMFAGE